MAWRLLCGSSEGCADVHHVGVTSMEMLKVVEHPHAKGGSSDQAGWCGLAGSCPTVSVGDFYILQSSQRCPPAREHTLAAARLCGSRSLEEELRRLP
ncbi:unnamed protein product [Plutella xylostella]|uniref:(diamondback moth) hypothetical protein n=1 Tax=Plutella xylostella TaxID=51655 RepID=A0A8S4GD55_PLUXY|nr:unnamed protein product [Plutella xylostella]